jgi:hypothetical protein
LIPVAHLQQQYGDKDKPGAETDPQRRAMKGNPDVRSSACQICIKRHIDDKYDFTWQFILRKYNC